MAVAAALALIAPGCDGARLDRRHDSVVIGIPLEPPNLDPTAGAAAAIDEVVYANVFEGLTRIAPDGSVRPGLAESWAVSTDGLRYTFSLRRDVTFHDGTPFNAEDVAFALNRARAPTSTNAQRGYFEPIDRIEIQNPYSVEVTLKRPTGAFLFNLGQGDAVIVGAESAAKNATQPIGTGPFRFKEWRRGDSIELERYEGYWGPAPKIRTATFRIVPDPAAAAAALRSGDVDAFPAFPSPEVVAAFIADPRFKVAIGATEGETILAINNGRAPFDDRRVRQAICHAIDRDALIATVMFGFGTPIGSHFAPHHPDYVDLTGVCPFDPDEAQRLLREAGVTERLRVDLVLPPPTYARRGGEFIADALKRIGIDARLVPIEWAQWLKQVFADHDYDLTIVAHTEPMDIDIYARKDYYFQYKDKAFVELYARLAAASGEERSRLLAEAQQMIASDAVNAFLFQIPKIGIWNARLNGLWTDAPIQANDLTGVYWSDVDAS
jgi:peptide/nickel transport system substrate-binding protein